MPHPVASADLTWLDRSGSGSVQSTPVSSRYRFSAPFVVRLVGVGVVLAALVVLLLVLLGAVLAPRGAVGLEVVGPVAVVLLLAVAAAGVVVRRSTVVRFDETGYRVRLVRGAGVPQAEWKQVEDAAAATVGGARCVVLRLRDGRTTTVPVGLLAARSEDFVDDLRSHLNRGHGYRRVG